MKKLWILTALAIMAGCTQDTANNSFQTNSTSRPSWISGGIPEIQAVILSPEESYREPGGASLRGDCDTKYVLQLQRVSTIQENFILRVFSKDADSEGYSAVLNQLNLSSISDNMFVTVLLYDEDNNEICFDPTDNIGFIQPNDLDEDVEFRARLYNVSGPDSTAPETILWEDMEHYYYTMYPAASGDCMSNPDTCCEYTFEAASVASSVGDMRFGFGWDATHYVLSVPPNDDGFHNSTNCGPILVSWFTDDHVNDNGFGRLEFECGNSVHEWTIGDVEGIHGVLMDPFGRMCFLEY